MNDPVEQFKGAMRSADLTPPDTITGDGKIHRFSTNGKRSDTTGWYVLHLDGIPGWAFGDWRQGKEFTRTWCAKADKDMTQEQLQANRRRHQAAIAQRDAEKAQEQQSAAARAQKRWNAATPCTQHEYLRCKGIEPSGARIERDKLLIALRDTAGTMHSLQTIAPDGAKRFMPGGRVNGCYFGIGERGDALIVCEGFATGASLYACTGQSVAVAFNAGNLQEVALALRAEYPALKITIAADDDHQTSRNHGLTQATAAAQAVGGFLAVPEFPAGRGVKHTDFNDLHQSVGADAVKTCIEAARALTAPTAPESLARNSVVLVSASALTPAPVRWLWQDWLARGKFHLLAGAPGQGKTTIAMGLAATVTAGGLWPDGSRCDAGTVLIWSGEDDYADTLLPRLISAGADKSRVHFVNGTIAGGTVRPFDPATDTQALQRAVQEVGDVRLIVVDPISTAVVGDSHKNAEVRRGLQPLVDLAVTINAALLGITHFSKGGQGADPAQRVIGSVAFTAVARVVLVAARVRSDDGADRRILARSKSNIGPDDGGFEYRLTQVEALPGIDASRVEWGQAVEGSARELLTDPAEQDDGASPDDAANLLKAELVTDGWTTMTTASKPLKEAGLTKKQIWTASKKIQVVRKKSGMDGPWYWRLPGGADPALPHEDSTRPKLTEDSAEDSEHSPFQKVGSLESSWTGLESSSAAAAADREPFEVEL